MFRRSALGRYPTFKLTQYRFAKSGYSGEPGAWLAARKKVWFAADVRRFERIFLSHSGFARIRWVIRDPPFPSARPRSDVGSWYVRFTIKTRYNNDEPDMASRRSEAGDPRPDTIRSPTDHPPRATSRLRDHDALRRARHNRLRLQIVFPGDGEMG